MVYNVPTFGVVYSKSCFMRQLVNCQFDCCLVLRAGQPGLEIRNWDLLRTRLDVTNAIEASEIWNEPPLKITVFEVSHLSRFSWNCYNLWYGAPFWKSSIALDLYWRVESNFKVKTILTDVQNFDILDDFAPRVGIWRFEIRSGSEGMESFIGLV